MRPSRRLAAALAATALTSLAAGGASAQPSPTPAAETLFLSAGCPSSTPGSCTSVRWLGKRPGDATSNFLTATTPVDEVTYRATGDVNWRDYSGNDTLRPGGYPLRADQPVTMAVAVTARGVAVNATVHGRVEAATASGDLVTFGPAEQVITLTPETSKTVTFRFPVPEELDGVVLESLSAFVAVHGVNAQGGYIDQKGGSTLTLPYWATPAG